MCGITGWIDWEKDLQHQNNIISKMTTTLTNRGPDASDIWLSTHAVLGHRRLVVVDPTGGGQPMIRYRGDKKYILVYNGELYNTDELRDDLKKKDIAFSSHSDTEVLLQAYIAWGEDCVKRLNGIFAFAIWDETEQSLFMARDRFGVKPLFYAQRGKAFLFGSEPKALLANPLVKAEVDKDGIAEIFVIGPARTPGHGIFKDIFELKPGHCLAYNRNRFKISRYWSLQSSNHEDDLDMTTEKIRFLVEDSIKRQLVADVPVCTFLSGGLDSSAITAITAQRFLQENKNQLHTYSVDYENNATYFKSNSFQPNSDADWVNRVSNNLGTVHHNIVIDNQTLVDALTTAMLANDRPGMADIDASLLLFCQEVKKSATVALSGECADEIFGGYPWFHRPESLAATTFPWALATDDRAALLASEIRSWINPLDYVTQRYGEALSEVPRLAGEPDHDARIREIFYLNITRFMPTLLDRKDRMSMATGLEVRVPFCDHRLVEYVWNIPWSMKYYGQQEKGLLRRALQGVLPQDVLARKKSPYPKTHNPAYLTAVKSALQETLSGNSPLLTLINQDLLSILLADDGHNSRPWFGQLMNKAQLFAYLLQIDLWLRKYKVSIQ